MDCVPPCPPAISDRLKGVAAVLIFDHGPPGVSNRPASRAMFLAPFLALFQAPGFALLPPAFPAEWRPRGR